nr:gag pol polyprotein [Hymenolepis microstoma]
MRLLASGCELQDEMLKGLWLNNLPERVISLLEISPYQDDLDKLAEVADRNHSRRERPSVHAVKISTDVDTLSEQVGALSDRFKKLELLISGSSPRHNRQRSTSPGRRRSHSRQDYEICYHHQTYGNMARRCRPGCNYAFDLQTAHGLPLCTWSRRKMVTGDHVETTGTSTELPPQTVTQYLTHMIFRYISTARSCSPSLI